MRIHRTRANLPLLIFSFIATASFLGICLKWRSLNATAIAEQSSTSSDSAEHFVIIFDNQEKTVLRSSAKTVQELLSRAEIELQSGDKVEPALDEAINSDNFNINIYRARPIVVIDGEKELFIRSSSTDPETIVADAGIKLLSADRVELIRYQRFFETGMTNAYYVKRAKNIHLDLNGSVSTIRTQAKYVKDFLLEQNIDTDPSRNWVSLSLDSALNDQAELSVYFQGKHSLTTEEQIPFSERTTMDYSLPYGSRNITQAGKDGKKTVVYDVEMRDGRIISRTLVSELVTEAPVEQQVTVGMKINLPAGSHEDWMSAAGISPNDYGYVNFIISHESGWRTTASNGKYFGLYQTSKDRLAAACPNWQSDPVCQLRSATSYAAGRYGSWENAYNYWTKHHWW